jgi:hypothetical protein
MRIRIWNAFASNNSGAYTLVGCFVSPERAREVAQELRVLFEKHDSWVSAARSNEPRDATSPLRKLAEAEGLSTELGVGEDEDWPEYDEPTTPGVTSVGYHVLVHHPYTATMTPLIGGLFYMRVA